MPLSAPKFLTLTSKSARSARGAGPKLALTVMVHIDAFVMAPGRYLHAIWWSMVGKRLRSRLKLAPLLGQSRWAYRLWIMRQGNLPAASVKSTFKDIKIVGLVQTGRDVERTLTSLASEKLTAIIIDGSPKHVLQELREADRDTWLLPMLSGDLLAIGAGDLYRSAAARASEETQAIYADDDLIDAKMRRRHPHLKPDWNSELFKHFDYVTGAALLRIPEGSFDELTSHNWAQDLTMRATRQSKTVGAPVIHLPRILHHRRSRFAPNVPPSKPASLEANGDIPTISVIIPTRNRHDLLRVCLYGLASTNYPSPVEILVIDNGSDDPDTLEYLDALNPQFVRVLRDDGPFNFAAINNRAVEHANGELLCFLNNDIEITDPDWLLTMAAQACRTEIGAVGAQLLYPDGRLQHGGVVLGVGGGASHAHRLLVPTETGYFNRHSMPQFVSAVTAACLVVQKRKFMAIEGFDAEKFAVSFNDVDLCLRLDALGWRTLYEPRAKLVHHESISRGLDRDPTGAARLARETEALHERWGPFKLEAGKCERVDPFHHPLLSPFSEQFVLEV
ncbi:MAG: glycosyl transferase [Sphingomonadaceae bacterium]|nr:glycosyl transferase [Sphingomonadaceae bacterium]|tara:strand:+ start:1465 stop:3150 length:1686 start_codon:yes stop_codon:yes gene_type:complete